MPNIANKNARKFVERRDAFKGSNLYAKTYNERYVVFSYRDSWPLFIYDPATQRWYENITKISQSTSRHASQARPWGEAIHEIDNEAANALVWRDVEPHLDKEFTA